MPRSKGHAGEKYRAHKVPRDPNAHAHREAYAALLTRPTLPDRSRYGLAIANVIDCSHGVPWTTCTTCSKPRIK